MHIDGTYYRTIWVDTKNPVIIKIIDQRHLPHRFVVEDLLTLEDAAIAIRDMHVRGAGLIGATAGFGMYLSALEAGSDVDGTLAAAALQLIRTRPTARNLAWAVERVLRDVRGESTREDKLARTFATACTIADEDADYCRRIGEHGLPLIEEIARRKIGKPVNILTHCNAGWLAFVDYGSATAPIYAAHKKGIPIHVWVDETRPWLQGARLTAWELGQEGVPYTVIADNTGGHLMQHGKVDMVIVGSDRTTRSGDVANKIGTYLKALAAHDNGVPFYVALPSSTLDWNMLDGIREIPIEERSGDEVHWVNGVTAAGNSETVRITPLDSPAANYGFDVTPARLVSGIITERGVAAASESGLLTLFPESKNTSFQIHESDII